MALDLIAELELLVDAFEQANIDYAICGGIAMTVHGHVRATVDIDVLITPEDLARAMQLSRDCGFDVPARKMVFGLKTGTPREVQRLSKLDPETNNLLTVGLLLVGPGYEDVWATRERVLWKGRNLGVVSRAGLVTMKRIAGRPQDLADIAKLEGTDDDET